MEGLRVLFTWNGDLFVLVHASETCVKVATWPELVEVVVTHKDFEEFKKLGFVK